jgi:hypothetical protein
MSPQAEIHLSSRPEHGAFAVRSGGTCSFHRFLAPRHKINQKQNPATEQKNQKQLNLLNLTA